MKVSKSQGSCFDLNKQEKRVINLIYFSNREKKILQLITQKDQGAIIDDMMRILDVSKRTVYRELSNLEDSLQRIHLSLVKEGKFYRIEGKEADILYIQDYIEDNISIEWLDVDKRGAAILATIALCQDGQMTHKRLVEEFQLSWTTIQQSVQRLNEIISKYHIQIEQKMDNSLILEGNEVYVRLYLSQVLSREINEFDFFNTIREGQVDKIENESQYILSLVPADLLQMIYRAIEDNQAEIIEKLSDDNLMNFVINIAVSLLRLKQNYSLLSNQTTDHDQLFPYMQQLLSIVKVLDSNYKALLNTNELTFLAMHLRGMNLSMNHSIFQKSYDLELGYSVKYLIRLISKAFNYNFNHDDTLYRDLINHIGAALKRLDLNLPEMENTVIEQLKKNYAKLYQIVEDKLIEVFSHSIFSEQEIGYVVVHFASSFEKQGYTKDIQVLVICSSGIGTSKILKARLERAITEINTIQVVRAIELIGIDLEDFDIIFSTIVLTGFEYDYHLINPILDDQEIKMVKARIDQIQHKKDIIKRPHISTISSKLTYNQVKSFMKLSEQVIDQFDLINIKQPFDDIEAFMDEIFSDNRKLKEKILNRLYEAPLLIPNTGIMLLHTTDTEVQQAVLKLYDLQFPISAMGMDREQAPVKRIILMLGPAEMDEQMADFLGSISSSIIESIENTKIYGKGNIKEVKNLLEQISLNFLQNMMN